MGKIDYKAIYDKNKHGWFDMTENPQKYEALLAGHYSDSNHFVYELLQNAEDERASKVVIEYYDDKLVFYHNGEPFDEADVRGVSSMLMGTKDRDDAQTIGRFGMGFKSVFKYTYQPEIYSDDEAFKITRYLLPVENTDSWDYKTEKDNIKCKLGDGKAFFPFKNEEHLTKIIIPFLKYGKGGELEHVPGNDVLDKLGELDGEILLFLSNIRNLYWTNKENGHFARISLSHDEKDEHLITCRIEGTEYGGKEDISRYLKFKKVFNHKEMNNAEVSVAYRLNSRADNINEVEDSPIWVYFPTRDETDLPFLIHGSFETAVSREKLMTPSKFNSDLFDKLGDLVAESLDSLADRKLITQAFLRRIIIPAFKDEFDNDTIPGIKYKLTKAIKDKGLLPDKDGDYKKPSELKIPIPFKIADFLGKIPFMKPLENAGDFVAFNNEKEANFNDYYSWLIDDLGVGLYKLSELAGDLSCLEGYKIPNNTPQYNTLKDFYEFLSDNRESLYETGLTFSRSGAYESEIRKDISLAWRKLRKAPIILNRLNKLMPTQDDEKPVIYLGSSSEYKSVMQSALVHTSISQQYRTLLTEGFQIPEFNNFQYVKEKVIQKYIDIEDTIGFYDSEDFTKEYIEDLNQIFALMEQTNDVEAVREMLEDAYIIKIKAIDEDGEESDEFATPDKCFVPISDEGVDLEIYYHPTVIAAGFTYKEIESESKWADARYNAIDKDYYESNGIAVSKLAKLGLKTSPVKEGSRSMEGTGDGYWVALGDYCPNISIDFLDYNLNFIERYPEHDLAKKKSAEVFKLLSTVSNKLRGKKRFRQRNPYVGNDESAIILSLWIKDKKWLYSKDFSNHKPGEISKYDLSTALYGELLPDKKIYENLGFIENETDAKQDTFEQVSNLDRADKMMLLRQLARDLGKEITDPSTDDWGDEDNEGEFFNANEWQDNEFPTNRVRNIDYLIRHVREQFYCADPTTYRKVWRQIRISKDTKADRAYAIGMYTNSGNVRICQMCRKPVAFTEVDQIANFGIEMPQLNLCLCRECSARYKAMRDANKDEFKKQIKCAILTIDISEEADDYSIMFDSEMGIHFTQTHLAEVQEILRLLSEYGTPSDEAEELYDSSVSGPLLHPAGDVEETEEDVEDEEEHEDPENEEDYYVEEDQEESESSESDEDIDDDVAREGSFITYKKINSDEIKDNTLQPGRFPLHKAFLGHRTGDIVKFMGWNYEILGVIND